jgi:chemotaxis signal transduction protein
MSFDVLYFEVRGRRCALPISEVREVLPAPPITPVPSAPPALRGLVPVHGQVLPLVDVGPQLASGSSGSGDAGGAGSARWDGDRIIVVETTVATTVAGAPTLPALDGEPLPARTPVRAALVANKVTRLGTVDEGHSRPPPPGPAFIRATVADLDGPALLLDPGRALESLRSMLLGLGAA